MLALQDPLDPDNEAAGNKFIAQMEQVFTVIFTVEVQQTRSPGQAKAQTAKISSIKNDSVTV